MLAYVKPFLIYIFACNFNFFFTTLSSYNVHIVFDFPTISNLFRLKNMTVENRHCVFNPLITIFLKSSTSLSLGIDR